VRSENRIFYVDAARACAILFVVASHVFAPVCRNSQEYALPVWWVFNLCNSIIRLCVPLFVMISGKLMLGSEREESYLRYAQRRFPRIVIPFFVWSMIYAYEESKLQGTSFNLGHAFWQFLNGPTEYHLWFMYMILGLYLVAPFLRQFAQQAERKDLEVLLLLWLGWLTVQFLSPLYAGSSPALTLVDYGGYFLLGYYLDQITLRRAKIPLLIFLAVGIVLFNAGGTYLLMAANNGTPTETFYTYVAPLVALYAASIFLILKSLDYNHLLAGRAWMRNAITWLSLESYNVYLMHALFLWIFVKGQWGFVLSEKTGNSPFLGVPLTTAVVLLVSLGVSFLLRKIPVVADGLVIS
jgi:surface polysaccharide O-acyltransferase-like enzyme